MAQEIKRLPVERLKEIDLQFRQGLIDYDTARDEFVSAMGAQDSYDLVTVCFKMHPSAFVKGMVGEFGRGIDFDTSRFAELVADPDEVLIATVRAGPYIYEGWPKIGVFLQTESETPVRSLTHGTTIFEASESSIQFDLNGLIEVQGEGYSGAMRRRRSLSRSRSRSRRLRSPSYIYVPDRRFSMARRSPVRRSPVRRSIFRHRY